MDNYVGGEGRMVKIMSSDGLRDATQEEVEGFERSAEFAQNNLPVNTTGFLLATMEALGKKRGREVMRDYADITLGIQRQNFEVAWDGINDARQDEAITDDEHSTIVGLWEEYNLPIASEEEE